MKTTSSNKNLVLGGKANCMTWNPDVHCCKMGAKSTVYIAQAPVKVNWVCDVTAVHGVWMLYAMPEHVVDIHFAQNCNDVIVGWLAGTMRCTHPIMRPANALEMVVSMQRVPVWQSPVNPKSAIPPEASPYECQ